MGLKFNMLSKEAIEEAYTMLKERFGKQIFTQF